MKDKENRDELVWAKGELSKKVGALISEFQRCSPWDGSYNRVTDNDDIRHCRWANQTPDGRKHDVNGGEKVFPWPGASDTRIPMADEIIGELVSVMNMSFWRAMTQKKASLREGAGYAVKLVDYFINEALTSELVKQVELSSQYCQTYGWFVLHTSWETELALKRSEVTLGEVLKMATSVAAIAPSDGAGDGGPAVAGQSPPYQGGGLDAATFEAMLMDGERDEECAAVLARFHSIYAGQVLEEHDVEVPPMSKGSLKKAVRELREKGKAELTVPEIVRDGPSVTALKPWVEIVLPTGCVKIQRGPVFHREWLDEVELRSRIVTHGWDGEWVEAACGHKGKISKWGTGGGAVSSVVNGSVQVSLNGTPSAASDYILGESGDGTIEVVYACYRALDEDNVPALFVTVLHPAIHDKAGKHGLADCDTMPYVAGMREMADPVITSSRGVPEVVAGWQREKKVQRDAVADLTSIAVLPPINIPASAGSIKYKFGPAVQNTVPVGREPTFMEIPKGGAPLAFEVMDRINQDADRYFGRAVEGVAAETTSIRRQHMVNGFMLAWSEAFQQLCELAQYRMTDSEFARITGAPAGWLESRRNKRGLFYTDLHFDVRELDPAFVADQLKILNETVIASDTMGVIDRRKYTVLQLRAFNPKLAQELIMDESAASQELFDGVSHDLAMMFLGNAPRLVEMDPTAPTKLQFASQIVQANPKYMEELQKGEGSYFGRLLQGYVENLKFSMTQEKNKQIGRIGVDMEKMANGE